MERRIVTQLFRIIKLFISRRCVCVFPFKLPLSSSTEKNSESISSAQCSDDNQELLFFFCGEWSK